MSYAAQREKLVKLMEKEVEADGGGAAAPYRAPRASRVKNKQPAPVQISAEQIIREANERQDVAAKAPTQRITDPEELAEYRLTRRKEFEDMVRRARFSINVWVKYAQWEESQFELERARSIWERALNIEPRNLNLWLKLAEMEMRHRNINRARNVWDRAVQLLPRHDQLWYKYAYMEEQLGNYAGCRQVFERWMQWEPPMQAWQTYVNFEMRYNEKDRARSIYQRMVSVHPNVEAWLKYAKYEEKYGVVDSTREVYEAAVDRLEEHVVDEELFLAFARFETRAKEVERARAIYKYALDCIPKAQASTLYASFVQFEKQHGDRKGVEDVIIAKRRFKYEDDIKTDPLNYDVWFDYIRLEEAEGEVDRARELFERAIAQVPPSSEKRSWRRYVFLWIKYAVFEELDCSDIVRARAVCKAALAVIPHKSFSFSKLWIHAAHLELRARDLAAARLMFGRAIGQAPREKIFKAYIEMELQLGNLDRCRTLYQKFIEWAPENCGAWARYAELEQQLGETERARQLFEVGVEQPVLDLPEALWKAYIDFEISEANTANVRGLYNRLLERTTHPKVFVSFAQFEASSGDVEAARAVYTRGDAQFKGNAAAKEERLLVLEAWLLFEQQHGDAAAVAVVEAKMPKQLKKKRPVIGEDGAEDGWEEYVDYLFPDESGSMASLKILEAARAWKKQKASADEGAQ